MLADLFDVISMSLEIPDYVLEDEPGLELIPCPACDALGWLECYGSAYARNSLLITPKQTMEPIVTEQRLQIEQTRPGAH